MNKQIKEEVLKELGRIFNPERPEDYLNVIANPTTIDKAIELTEEKILNLVREVLIDYGLSDVESDRVLDDKKSFESALKDVIEKQVSEK